MGENKNSVLVYKDTLVSSCFTLGIEGVDIIALVEKFKGLYFSHALKWICDVIELDYYSSETKFQHDYLIDDWKWLDKLMGRATDEEEFIKPLSEHILSQYIPYPHIDFYDSGISINTQKEFGICFDVISERIIIPIYDELNTFVGVKGRRTDESHTNKYIYLYPCPKSKILFGLHKSLPHIQEKKEVIIAESEKGVMQLWSNNIKNSIAISGKTISSSQIEKLLKLNVDITIALDKGVSKEEVNKIIDNFRMYTQVYVIWDKDNILEDKESPMDNIARWNYLYKKRMKVNN